MIQPGKIFFFHKANDYTRLLGRDFIVEPGDKIQIEVDENGHCKFSGNSAAKYTFSLSHDFVRSPLQNIGTSFKKPQEIKQWADSALNNYLRELNKYPGISIQVKNILALEATGGYYRDVCRVLNAVWSNWNRDTTIQKAEYVNTINSLNEYASLNDETVLFSTNLIDYLYEKIKLQLILELGNPHLTKNTGLTFETYLRSG